jgi:hypothetical protein
MIPLLLTHVSLKYVCCQNVFQRASVSVCIIALHNATAKTFLNGNAQHFDVHPEKLQLSVIKRTTVSQSN